MNTRQAPRTLNLTLNENTYQSQFYTSDADKLIRKLKAEQDLKTYRENQKKQFFNIKRKQTKTDKKIIKQQQKEQQKQIKQQKKEQQKEEIKKLNIEFKKKQKQQKQQQKQIKKKPVKQDIQKLTDEEKIKILETMRDNIKASNEIKDFYEVDIKYFPVNKIQLFKSIDGYNEYLRKNGDRALMNIEVMKRNQITYPDSDIKELILSLFYNIYKKYKNRDVIFIYINNNFISALRKMLK